MTPPTPTPNLAPPELWLDKARAGSDEESLLFVAALVIFAVTQGIREWLTNRGRSPAPPDRGETERGGQADT